MLEHFIAYFHATKYSIVSAETLFTERLTKYKFDPVFQFRVVYEVEYDFMFSELKKTNSKRIFLLNSKRRRKKQSFLAIWYGSFIRMYTY